MAYPVRLGVGVSDGSLGGFRMCMDLDLIMFDASLSCGILSILLKFYQ